MARKKVEKPLEENKYGILLGDDIKIQRGYFEEMCRLIGINVLVRIPKPGKTYTNRGELDANYEMPVRIGCIFQEYPDQATAKKLGWIAELQDNVSIIHLPYDTPGLQIGTLVIVPSGIDKAEGRVFRITKMSNIMVYPASISCQVVPEWSNTAQKAEVQDFKHTDFNVLFDPSEVEDA